MKKHLNSGWHLEDVEESNKRAPASFRIPTFQERDALKAGNVVKLHFVLEDGKDCRAERMWVRVNRISEGRLYGGLLDAPVRVPNLSRGDEIEFEKKNVASILIPKGDPLWIDVTKHAFVSNRVLTDKQPICFLYRETPDKETDSGWRIFAGDEDEEYSADPQNIQMCSLEALLNLDESLEVILSKPVFSAFERKGKIAPFEEVKDFEFGRDCEGVGE